MWLPTLLGLFLMRSTVDSANILTIIPFPSFSHQQPLLALSKELALRGHNLTVITTNPPQEHIPNYKAIDTSSTYQHMAEVEKTVGFTLQKTWNAFVFVVYMAGTFAAVCEYQLALPEIQELIRLANQTKFDAVLYEDLMYGGYLGLVHKLGSPPVIGVHTFPPFFTTDDNMGVPVNPAFMPDVFIGYTDEMDFLERTYNTIMYWWWTFNNAFFIRPYQEKILRKFFGPDPPTVKEMENNKSLLLMPTDLTVTYPQPLPPNYIQLGSLHIVKSKPLPKDLQKWMDEAKDGVVYFSFGCNMKGTSLKDEKREAFLKAFSQFPNVRFLWKWESDEGIPGQPENVLTRKWFPQQDVLGHPKILCFISQGGLQSTEESLYRGIPLLTVPLFGDQRHNAWKVAKEGAGISIEMHQITFDTVYNSLKKILHDKSYKENAVRLSALTRDHLNEPMETAVWWIEYVIRHNGAKHLRLASHKLAWYQYILLDVYSFLFLILFVILYISYKIVKKIVAVFRIKNKKVKSN